MPPRRKKHSGLRIINDEILPSRRSSLQVNLSYVSNLSDSGNGSFRSTQPENYPPTAEKSRISLRKILSLKIPEESCSDVSPDNSAVSAMSEKETALGESCELLKDAIMNKTREIFDGRAELAMKTATILKGQRQALKEIMNDDSAIAGTNRSVISTNVIRSSKNRTFERPSDIVASRRTSKAPSSISRCDKSLVLGGSEKSRNNESTRIKEKILMIKLTRIADPRLDISMESNISDIGAPITCSSFIAGHGNYVGPPSQGIENNLDVIGANLDVIETSTRNVEESMPSQMEITGARSRFPFASLLRRSDVSRTEEKCADELGTNQAISMELTSVQSHMPQRESSSSKKITRASLNVNRSASESSEMKNSPNDRVARISLKVNTSIEADEPKTGCTENYSSSDDNHSFTVDKDEIARSMASNVERNDTMISDSDADSIENMSLMARLRNITREKPNQAKRSSAGEGPSFVEGTPYPPSRSILWRTQNRTETIGGINNGTSLKRKIFTAPAKISTLPSDSDSSMSSREYTTAPCSALHLDDSPSRITCGTKNPQIIEDSSEANESARATSETIPHENSTLLTQRTGKKKKLLPLRDNFQIVSFSPVSTGELTPKKPITWKPRKHFRKRKTTRAIAEKRIEALRRDNEAEDDYDEAACSSLDNIKTQIKVTRIKKARKVISKKIVVKKIASNELSEGFGRKSSEQSAVSERGSMNVFLKKKRLSVAERNFKPQKLIIVATGFSKGDVDLVKSVVKELGGAEMSSTVTRRTTHVVSTGVRTINLLRGIIRGCWLVSLEWVLKSLENNEWLNAERYEMVHFSKAVQENRRDRQNFGRSYVPELFTTCGPIHIEHGTSPPPETLKELVKTAGGRITENQRDARLSVGPNGLREIWILDSITTGDLQPVDEYRKKIE